MTALTFCALRRANAARCEGGFNHRLGDWSPADWMVAIGGEVGEALNLVKKLNRERDGIKGNTLSRADLVQRLGSEISDAVIYVDLTLASFDLELFGELREPANFDQLMAMARRGLQVNPLGFSMSQAGEGILRGLGKLATATYQRDRMAVAGTAATLVLELAGLAELAGIDLGPALVATFNATSDKIGWQPRLEESPA
jgi:hypothetical protein